ncbi:MAG: hypothetical protein AVDCRST_MAG13-1176, partial [uncultured Solirubrobacteraceae bacterium]
RLRERGPGAAGPRGAPDRAGRAAQARPRPGTRQPRHYPL